MSVKDPREDLAFYMTEKDVADTAATMEPILLHGGSKAAAGTWVGLVGILGGAFGLVTLSPAIRHRMTFAAYVIVAAALLRGLHPLTARVLGRAVAWLAMFAFFWAALDGMVVFLSARIETTWIRWAIGIGGGAFVGMMYGAFPPGVVRSQDAWMLAFLLAPMSVVVATYVLRLGGGPESLGAAAGAGALAGLLFIGPMGALLVRLWDEAKGLAELGELYLHNETFAPKAVAYLDRAITMSPATARYYDLRAMGLAWMNEAERAAADWDHASRLAPDDPEPYLHRGVDALRRGTLQDAVRSLESALEKNAGHGRAHAYLGAACERQGDLKRAFELYDRAVALAPEDARVYCARSKAYVRRGDYAKALQDAERAVQLEERLGLAYAARSQALALVGRVEEAEDNLREAIECGLEPDVHEEVLRRMESQQGGEADEGSG